jgi:O-acetylserine/cysteine efflux transporter
MRPLHLLLMLLINLAWGINIIPVKLALDHVPPITAAFVRFAILAIICAPALRWWHGQMGLVFGYGLIGGALAFMLGNASFAFADNVSAISIVGQLGVPFSLLLAIIFLGERIHLIRTFGIFLAFAGVALLSFDPHVLDERSALLLAVFASFFYATGTIFVRQLRGVSGLSLQGWLALLSAPITLGAALLFEPQGVAALPQTDLKVFGYLFLSAVMASIFGHAGFTYLLQRYPVQLISPMTMLAPFVAVACGILYFGNQVTPELIGGGLLTLAGVGIITLRNAQKSVD